MRKNVLIIEDDDTARKYIENIDEEKYRVYLSKTLKDADYRINTDPSIANIAGIIVDLRIISVISKYDFNSEEEDLNYLDGENENVELTGWVWLRRFLINNPEFPRKRIAIVSAYVTKILPKDVKNYCEDITIIDKTSDGATKEIKNFLENLQN